MFSRIASEMREELVRSEEAGAGEEEASGEGDDFAAVKARMKEMEEEAEKIRAMQSEVEKQMNMSSSSLSSSALNQSMEEKMEADAKSIYVGNVDYGATAEELEAMPTEALPGGTDEPTLRDWCLQKTRTAMRVELTDLEQFVLLHVLDQCWKDHLYAITQARDSVSLRGYAEKDPRIEFKREGARLFQEMQGTVRDRVTDLVFRARHTPNVRAQSAYGEQQTAAHPQAQAAPVPQPAPVGAGAPAGGGAAGSGSAAAE